MNNYSIRLNGQSTLRSPILLNPQEGSTLSLWVKFDEVVGLQHLFEVKGENSEFSLYIQGSDLYLKTPSSTDLVQSGLSVDRWYHLVLLIPDSLWGSLKEFNPYLAAAYDFSLSEGNIKNLGYGPDARPIGRIGEYIEKSPSGSAYKFESPSMGLDIGERLIDGTDFTFATWYYWSGSGSDTRILSCTDNPTTFSRELWLSPYYSSGQLLRFGINAPQGSQILTTPYPLDNVWQHLVVTLIEDEAKIYVNGEEVAKSTSFTNDPNHIDNQYCYLGMRPDNSQAYRGSLDATYIWNHGLLDGDVKYLYNKGLGRFKSRERAKIFIDGQVVYEYDPSDLISGNLVLGGPADKSSSLHGSLDQVNLWSRGLNDTEIVDLFNSGNSIEYHIEDSEEYWHPYLAQYDNHLRAAWNCEAERYSRFQLDVSGNLSDLNRTQDHFHYESEGFRDYGVRGYGNSSGWTNSRRIGFDYSPFMISFWARLADTTSTITLLGVRKSSATDQDLRIHVENDKLYMRFYNDDIGISNIPYRDNKWHHYMFSWDKETRLQRLFFDGKLLWERVSTGDLNCYDTLYVGRPGSSAYETLNGQMDEIYIWDTCATNTKTMASLLYNKGVGRIYRGYLSSTNRGVKGYTPKDFFWPPVLQDYDSNLTGLWPLIEYESGFLDVANGLPTNKVGTLNSWFPDEQNRLTGARFTNNPSNYISISDHASLDVTSFTISFWILAESWANSTNIMFVDRMNTSGSGDGWYIRRQGNSGPIRFGLNLSGTDYYIDSDSGTPRTHEAGGWHHIAASWTGSSLKMWVDGVKQNSEVTTPTGTLSSTRPIHLGRSGSGSEQFYGTMSTFALWDSPLSTDAIQALYNGRSGVTFESDNYWSRSLGEQDKNLIGYFPLNDGKGKCKDHILLNHGSVYGSPDYESPGKVDKSIGLDGSTDYIEIPHKDGLNLSGKKTLSIWFKRGESWLGDDSRQTIFSKGSSSSFGSGLSIRDEAGGPLLILWEKNPQGLQEFSKKLPSTWAVSDWTLLQVVYSERTATLYCDRETLGTLSIQGVETLSPIQLGAESGINLLKGYLEQLLLWKTNLRSQTLFELWNQGRGRLHKKFTLDSWGDLSELDSNLLHVYKFDQTGGPLPDEEQSWDGSPGNTPQCNIPGQDGGSANHFRRSGNQYYQMTQNSEWSSLTEFTVSYWVYIDSYPSDYGGQIVFYNGRYGEVNLGVRHGGFYKYLRNLSSNYTPSIKEEWVHVVTTWKRNAYQKLYVNGELIDTASTPDSPLHDPGSWEAYIGRDYDGNRYDGRIDELYIWDTELKIDTIKKIYNKGYGRFRTSRKFPLVDLEKYLVSYWKLEDTSGEDLFNKNPLIANGTPSITPSIDGDGLDFNGSSSMWNLDPYMVPSSGETYAIGCWINISSLPVSRTSIWAIDTDETNEYISLDLLSTGYLRHIENHGSEVFQASTASLSLGVWHYIVCSYDGSKLHLFIDGVEQGAGTVAAPSYRSENFVLGQSRKNSTSTTYFDGIVDEVSLWNNELSPEIVKRLYLNGGGTSYHKGHFSPTLSYYDRALVNYLPLDDNSSTIHDVIRLEDYTAIDILLNQVGIVNSAAYFNGSSARFQVPTLLEGDFTISFWIRTTDMGNESPVWFGGSMIFDAYLGPGDQQEDFGIGLIRGRIAFGTGSPKHTSVSETMIADGDWHHIVVCRNRDTGYKWLYLDGLMEVEDKSGTESLATASLTVGCRSDSHPDSYFKGYLDEIGVWNTTLTPNAISSLYNLGRGTSFGRESSSWNTSVSSSDGNLISVWHLDETSGTLVDSIGSQDGTLMGTDSYYNQDGVHNSSLGFNGIDNYVVTVGSDPSPTDYTLSIWVKATDPTNMNFIYRGDSGSSWSHVLGVDTSGYFMHRVSDGSAREVTSYTKMTPGKWYHIVGTAEGGGTLRLYINGVEEASYSTLGTLWTGGDRWYFGRSRTLDYLSGYLDEVMYWNTALTSEQVYALYNSGTGRFYGV